ncbi:MAG: dioxygenase [Leptospiraceae bacterium]|nr:dioxygenase [Leptospiraceae bacterium]MCK6382062.1 dioxygenase [Leptospiraceae bacterium]NUM41020.1 dioxygenase [Leptospiraceae bacterium]
MNINLAGLKKITDTLPTQNTKMPVIFTSHGNPFDIPIPRDKREFWSALFELGVYLQKNYEIKCALVISAHWCTKGTFVNASIEQKQIYDYYGFPKEHYEVYYSAKGSPEIAHEVKNIIPSVTETADWGLDHGAWPIIMHLFPNANIPVFQLSINYFAKPEYHFELGRLLKPLRQKNVLIIGSGSLIHNLQLAGQKMQNNDMTPYSWEEEYDTWIKKQIEKRNFTEIINYETSHKLGKLAAPTPDHFVPVLYALGLSDEKEDIKFFYEKPSTLPAFSERSFIIS